MEIPTTCAEKPELSEKSYGTGSTRSRPQEIILPVRSEYNDCLKTPIKPPGSPGSPMSPQRRVYVDSPTSPLSPSKRFLSKQQQWFNSVSKWLVFVGLCSASMGIGFNWLKNCAIVPQLSIYYGEDSQGFKMGFLGDMFLYTQVLTGPIGTLINSKSFRLNCLMGALLTTVGPIFNYFCFHNWWLAITSAFLVGIAQGNVFSSPSSLAIRFFSGDQIPTIMSMIPAMMSIGSALGMWLPLFLMDGTTDPQEISARVDIINLVGLLITSPAFLLVLLFGRERPIIQPTTRNRSESIDSPLFSEYSPTRSIMQRLDSLTYKPPNQEFGWGMSNMIGFNNKNCFICFLTGSAAMGVWLTIMIQASTVLAAFGVNEEDSSVICLAFIVIGTFAAIPYMKIFNSNPLKGLRFSLFLTVVICAELSAMQYMLTGPKSESEKQPQLAMWVIILLGTAFSVISTMFVAVFGFCLSIMVQISSPASDCVTTGNMLCFKAFWSLAFNWIAGYFAPNQMAVIAVISGFTLLASWVLLKKDNSVNSLGNVKAYFFPKIMIKRRVFQVRDESQDCNHTGFV